MSSVSCAVALTFLRQYVGSRRRFTTLHGDSLTAFQDHQARRMIRHAVAHSSFFADLWDGCDLDSWRTLPAVDKRMMMANFSAYNTRGVDADTAMQTALAAEHERDFRPTVPGTDLTVGLSTGTSGHRGMFLVSPKEQASWAGLILARGLPDSLLRPPSGADCWRICLFHRASSNLYERLRSRFVRFFYHDLMTPLDTAVAAVNDESPHVLVGPPTMLRRLADEARAGRLTARPLRILSAAEVLEPQDAETIASAFDLPAVGQIYQCTEGLLAISCPHHRLHLQEDAVVVQTESLGDGRVTPIVTDLWRTTQPILRYRLGDVLTLDENPCPCGSAFRVIERIEGRQDDVCRFVGIRGGAPIAVFPDILRRIVLLASPSILDYAIWQREIGEATVYLDIAPGADLGQIASAVETEFARTLASYGCRPAQVSVESGVPAPERAGAKRRRVRNLVEREAMRETRNGWTR